MKTITILGASNSKNSINKELVNYAGSLLTDIKINLLDLNNYNLPIYSVDIENEHGIHPEAIRFYTDLSKGDAFIISFAEHNGSYTTAFKNVYDWASRVEKKVWGNKPVLLLSTSPGARGGETVLATAKATFPYMGAEVLGSLALPSFYDNFKNGKIINIELQKELKTLVTKLQNLL